MGCRMCPLSEATAEGQSAQPLMGTEEAPRNCFWSPSHPSQVSIAALGRFPRRKFPRKGQVPSVPTFLTSTQRARGNLHQGPRVPAELTPTQLSTQAWHVLQWWPDSTAVRDSLRPASPGPGRLTRVLRAGSSGGGQTCRAALWGTTPRASRGSPAGVQAQSCPVGHHPKGLPGESCRGRGAGL